LPDLRMRITVERLTLAPNAMCLSYAKRAAWTHTPCWLTASRGSVPGLLRCWKACANRARACCR
jgi:hypothetical protein